MKKEFKMVAQWVMSVLGIQSFAKDKEGKLFLTGEQEQQLSSKYGPQFVEQFKADLPTLETATVELTAEERLELEAGRAEAARLKERVSQLEAANADFQKTIALLEHKPTGAQGQVVELTEFEKKVKAAGVDLSLRHNRFLADYLQGKATASYSGDSTIDTQELKQEFGRYVDANRLEIIRSLVGATESTQYMSTILTDKTEVRATHASIDKIVQQFFPEFSPQGKTRFRPLTIKNFKLKANVRIIPSDVMEDVLGWLYDEQAQTLQSMPVVRYIITQLMKPKMDEERETMLAVGRYKEAQKNDQGVYVTDASEALDGYLTQLVDLYNADAATTDSSKLSGISWLQKGQVISAASKNVRTIIDKAVKQVSDEHPLYAKRQMKVHIDPVLADAYRREYLEEYKWLKNQDGTHKNDIDFSNFEFAELEGMRGTGCFFITPKENFKHLLSKDPSAATIRFQENHYSVDVMMEWWEGTGFWLAEAVFAYILPATATSMAAPAGTSTSSDDDDNDDQQQDGV